MSNRGFVRGRMAAVCIVFAGSVAALSGPAAATGMWTGGYIGFKTDFTDVNIDYTNTGTPEQNLSGVTAGFTAGYDVEMGNIVLASLATSVWET